MTPSAHSKLLVPTCLVQVPANTSQHLSVEFPLAWLLLLLLAADCPLLLPMAGLGANNEPPNPDVFDPEKREQPSRPRRRAAKGQRPHRARMSNERPHTNAAIDIKTTTNGKIFKFQYFFCSAYIGRNNTTT